MTAIGANSLAESGVSGGTPFTTTMTPTSNFTLTETGNSISGKLLQNNFTGNERHGLLEQFDNLSNAASGDTGAHTYFAAGEPDDLPVLTHNQNGDCAGKNKSTSSNSSSQPQTPYRGGPHSETSKPRNDQRDSHHMPAKQVSGIEDPINRGPAIQMDPKDHAKTSSNGQMEGSIEYRAKIGEMIENGNMRGAMAIEIQDVRRAAQKVSGDRTKYNGAIKEMLNYAKSEGIVPPNPNRSK